MGNVSKGEGFFRQTSRFSAGILCAFQGKATQYGGKSPAIWTCRHFWPSIIRRHSVRIANLRKFADIQTPRLIRGVAERERGGYPLLQKARGKGLLPSLSETA